MSIEWTKERPAAPGWYWHSECLWCGREDEGPVMTKVEFIGRELRAWPAYMDYDESLDDDYAFPGLWYGPVAPPPLPANG